MLLTVSIALHITLQLRETAAVSAALSTTLHNWLIGPRVVAGLVVGSCLGVAGALMQAIARNPLVSPDLLGVTAGAQLGLMASLVLPVAYGLPSVFLGGVLAAFATFALAGGSRTTPLRLILAGVAIGQALSAILTLLLSLNDQAAMVISLWNTGSLQQVGWDGLRPALWVLPVAALVIGLLARPLATTLLEDAVMRSLGVATARLRTITLLLASVLAALAIHLAGPLGFVGLLVPNLLRIAYGIHRPLPLLGLSLLWGGAATLLADTIGMALAPWLTMPFGVLSAILGALTLLALLHLRGGTVAHAPSAVRAHARRPRLPLPAFVLLSLGLICGLVFVGTFSVGSAHDTPLGGWHAWLAGDAMAVALADLRLPRWSADLGAGALLALAGVILQDVTRNPLAGPEILGVNQFAGLAVLATLTLAPHLGDTWRVGIAWSGAGLALALAIGLNLRHGLEPMRLTITGFALAGLAMALGSLLLAQYSGNVAQGLIWLVGSSYGRTWRDVALLLPWLFAGACLAALAARSLDVLRLGTDTARSLGLPVLRHRMALITLAAMLTAAAVATVGPVAFIGLLVPHGVRLLGFHRTAHRLVAAPLLGALLLLAADVLARALFAPLDIPLGIATAAVGTPAFLLLLARTWLRPGGSSS
nr:iron ABC transporter permease [Verticiella sp. GG226]